MGMFNPDKEEEDFFGNLYLKCLKKDKPMTTRRMLCVGGPHDGQWVDVELMNIRVILSSPAGPVAPDYGANILPTLENMKKLFASMVRRTTYVVSQKPNGEFYLALETPAQAGVGRPTASGTLSDPEEEAPSIVE